MRRCHVLAMVCALPLGFFARASIAFGEPHIEVTHRADSEYLLRWTQLGAVDVFVSPLPDAKVSAMRRLATDVRKSEYESPSLDIRRPYFLLRAADGATYRTAERLVPLQGGSNFRDLGGYPGAGGKHLRWGLMFRSAAMPKLTDADYQLLSSLKIRTVVDLRSQDERQLSPVDWRTKPMPQMIAFNYPGAVLFRRLQGYNGPAREFVTERLYWDIPLLLRQEYRILFEALLNKHAPLVFFDSVGEDRTGIATGLILSALGTPRDIIYEDYLLSTADRQPQNEMPDINLQDYAATNSEARFLIEYRDYTEKTRFRNAKEQDRRPLMDSRGRPLLQDAFEEIEAEYGSVTNYLEQMLGINAADIVKLREIYLE